MLTGLDHRSGRLDRFFDRFADLDSFKPQLNLASHQTRDIKQIIDEAGHVARLPVNRIERLGWARSQFDHPEDLDCIPNRCQWIAQLVSQHGQEFVLASISLPRLVVKTRIFNRDCCSVCKILGQSDIKWVVSSRPLGKDERDGPHRTIVYRERSGDHRLPV